MSKKSVSLSRMFANSYIAIIVARLDMKEFYSIASIREPKGDSWSSWCVYDQGDSNQNQSASLCIYLTLRVIITDDTLQDR